MSAYEEYGAPLLMRYQVRDGAIYVEVTISAKDYAAGNFPDGWGASITHSDGSTTGFMPLRTEEVYCYHCGHRRGGKTV
jgi:hypothetical protein